MHSQIQPYNFLIGVLFNNFYSVTPLCTPSRASFVTGLYPKKTGAWKNHGQLRKKFKTFANELQGHTTGYMGKLHLNGKTKSSSDFGDETRKFGFSNIDFQYNRGHWKYFNQTEDGVKAFQWKDRNKFTQNGVNETEHYATDFLFDRAIDFIDKETKNGNKFALMLSIADPHDPNAVRPPYDTMFDHFKFRIPKTARKAMRGNPSLPDWAAIDDFSPELANDQIAEMLSDPTRQKNMQQIFGMIKLVDDNIGKLLNYLDQSGLRRNTIVVFTSDHGDLMGEHARQNKGVPYKTSAQVPFVISWPGTIRKRRRIETAYTSVDFAPTILGLMGVKSDIDFDGIDASTEVLKRKLITNNKTQIRFMTDGKKKNWAAAVTNRYKLVLSRDEPWLFDLHSDPDELQNKFRDPEYPEIGEQLRLALLDAMTKYNFVLKQKSFLPDAPVCWDSKDEIEGWDNRFCQDLNLPDYSPACEWDFVNATCPRACEGCCEDTVGNVWLFGAMRTCDEMNTDERFCTQQPAIQFCPKSCGLCDE